jgi:hypothetical protein
MKIEPLPSGTAIARFCRALVNAKGDAMLAAESAKIWVDTPHVAMALKAAVTAQSTSDALAQFGIDRELVAAIRGFSVLGRLTPLMRRVPFRTRISRESAPAAASWVGEGENKPVQAIAYGANANLPEYKAACFVILSDELVKFSNPAADGAIRDSLARSVAGFLDGQFLDPSVTAVAGVRPASVTNGAQTVTSSGSTAADILGDLQEMASELESWEAPRWVMRPQTAAFIAGADASVFSGLRGDGRRGRPARDSRPVLDQLPGGDRPARRRRRFARRRRARRRRSGATRQRVDDRQRVSRGYRGRESVGRESHRDSSRKIRFLASRSRRIGRFNARFLLREAKQRCTTTRSFFR